MTIRKTSTAKMSINPKSFGLAAGIIMGIMIFVVTLVSMETGYARVFLDMLAGLYPGYTVSMSGSLLGLVYGLIDGFIIAYLWAWAYNALER